MSKPSKRSNLTAAQWKEIHAKQDAFEKMVNEPIYTNGEILRPTRFRSVKSDFAFGYVNARVICWFADGVMEHHNKAIPAPDWNNLWTRPDWLVLPLTNIYVETPPIKVMKRDGQWFVDGSKIELLDPGSMLENKIKHKIQNWPGYMPIQLYWEV